jgi:PilZ domain
VAHEKNDRSDDITPRVRSRVAVEYPVSFTSDQVSGQGLLKNLTISGSEIESTVPFSIGAHLRLDVQLSGARAPITISHAVVRWKRDGRFGLEFVRFEGKAKQQLEDMFNQHDGELSE